MHKLVSATEASRQLREAVLADPGLRTRIAAIADFRLFAERLVAEAARRGIALAEAEVASMSGSDPLGLGRFAPRTPDGEHWPDAAWMPVHAGVPGGEPCVEWLHFGVSRPSDPFFEYTIRAARALPFNRAFAYRMGLADFVKFAEAAPKPDGLIFHMSRCGSTLVAQMIMALPASLVISEAPPLDEILQLSLPHGADAAVSALRAMAAAFGRCGGRPFVLKLDAWHALALPLFRRAFPNTPWVFLYRDPLEVLASQMRQRGAQMLPHLFPPRFWGIDLDEVVPDEDYCARVLGAICHAAADHAGVGGGLILDYRDLPNAVYSRIAPHFGLTLSAAERTAMEAVTERNVKAPHQTFTPDGEAKRREASESARQAAERHLGAAYRRLSGLASATAAPNA